jgi:glutamine synthetase
MEKGVGFDSSSTPGFKSLEAGDMVLIPDLTSGFVEPFFQDPTLSFFVDIVEADTREGYHRDPRHIADMADKYLAETGIASECLWGPEFEYYIFDGVEFHDSPKDSSLKINSDQYPRLNYLSENQQLGYKLSHHDGYHACPPYDTLNEIRNETVKVMEDCNIPVKYHHHEVGGSGQVEIEILFGNTKKMGDTVMLTKYIIKNVTKRFGKVATFMPKPIFGEAGSGMHFHQHLFKDGKPLFYDEKGYGGLSKLAQSYVAGILKNSQALVALTNPSTNSYKRLVPGYEAPVNLFFSLANRSSAIRIPKYATSPESKRIEFRPPDASCNPYLAMAGMLLAGIEGVQQNLDITKEGFGPYDMNLFDDKYAEIREKIQSVPDSLEKALVNLAENNKFLRQKNIFTQDMIDVWINEKIKNEILPAKRKPTIQEFDLYFNV